MSKMPGMSLSRPNVPRPKRLPLKNTTKKWKWRERERDIIRQAQLVALERALKVFEEETFGISTVNIEKYLNELTVSRISYTYVLLSLENNFGFFILLSYYFFSRKRGLFAVLNKCLSS